MHWLRDQLRKGMNVRTYALVGVLVGVFVWIQSLDSKQRAIRVTSRADAAGAPAAPAMAATAAASGRKVVHASVSPGWGLDPFARRFSAVGAEGSARAAQRSAPPDGAPRTTGLHLQGVVAGPLGRSALINGTMYREGERIGTREVLQIGQRSVLLLDHGTVTTLHLRGEPR